MDRFSERTRGRDDRREHDRGGEERDRRARGDDARGTERFGRGRTRPRDQGYGRDPEEDFREYEGQSRGDYDAGDREGGSRDSGTGRGESSTRRASDVDEGYSRRDDNRGDPGYGPGGGYGQGGPGGYGGGSGYSAGTGRSMRGDAGHRAFEGEGDHRSAGPHAGVGPRGYERSAERLRDDVCEHLTHHGWIDASEIEVSVENGEVTLTGTVENRAMKRAAEEVAESVRGVRDVHNRLTLRREGEGSRQSEGSSAEQNEEGATGPQGS